MGKIAEFTKVPDIVEAYEDQKIPDFAIFHDSQLRVKWQPKDDETLEDGAAVLQSFLEKVEASGSYAIYTLRVYDDLKGAIKNTTPYDCSVNFQFNRGRSGMQAGMGSVEQSYKGQSYTDLAVENAILKKRIEELENEKDSPEGAEMGGVIGMIDKLSTLPGMDQVIGAIAAKVATFIAPKAETVEPLYRHEQPLSGSRVLSGFPDLTTSKRIDFALSQLQEVVPDLADILEKLNRMAKTQPTKFKIYMAALRAMKI